MEFYKLETLANKLGLNLNRLALKNKNKYIFISINNIKYVESSSYYVDIHTLNNEKYLHRISIKDLLEKLDSKLFLRVNRSTIINVLQVKELISEGQGDFSILMLDGSHFSLSKLYKKEFLSFFDIR